MSKRNSDEVNPYLIVAGGFVDNGGMDRANLELAKYVVAHGHDVHVVAHRVNAHLARSPGVHSHHVPRVFGFGMIGERALDLVGRATAARLGIGTRIVVNGGNCALHAVNWVHFVHRLEGHVAQASVRSRTTVALARWSEGQAIAKARVIIANSERTRHDLRRAFPASGVQIHRIYCGIDGTRFFPVDSNGREAAANSLGFRADRKRVAFVGALGDERKGFDTLFSAWKMLAREWQDFEVVVVGTGRMLSKLIRQTKRENLADRLHFLGHRSDVAQILKSSDVLVAPSRYESYGLNIVEALATGLPVIATVTAGASELVHGELRDLLLSDPRSSTELVAKLSKWRAADECYRQLALKASPEIRVRSWNAMSAEIYRLIEETYNGPLVA